MQDEDLDQRCLFNGYQGSAAWTSVICDRDQGPRPESSRVIPSLEAAGPCPPGPPCSEVYEVELQGADGRHGGTVMRTFFQGSGGRWKGRCDFKLAAAL